MIQINIGDHSGSENGIPFSPIPARYRSQVVWARTRAIWIAGNLPGANKYFSSLTRGRSLSSLVHDRSIWVNYHPTLPADGGTFQNHDLWLGKRPFLIGTWMVLATIIHELAHIAGAPGAAIGASCNAFSLSCHAAERAVLECGLGRRSEARSRVDDTSTPYNPNISG